MPAFGLKYLFGVHYKDGSEFFQSPSDVSSTDPKRSAFFDVRQDEVELFQLRGDPRGQKAGRAFVVDLRDGHFEIDGAPFFAAVPPAGSTLRLIFFRRHRHHFNIGMKEIGHEVEYHFGWQTTVEGVNHKQTLILT
jgi:hypothetical protein